MLPYSHMKPYREFLKSDEVDDISENWVIVNISFSDASSVYGPFESYEDAASYMLDFEITGEIVFMQKDSVN